jgi:hypothetical protein
VLKENEALREELLQKSKFSFKDLEDLTHLFFSTGLSYEDAKLTARTTAAETLVENHSKLRSKLRASAGLRNNNSAPICVVRGGGAPTRHGEAAHSTFKNGGLCTYPGSAMKAGYKVIYHPSTLVVEVGPEYVLIAAGVMTEDQTKQLK